MSIQPRYTVKYVQSAVEKALRRTGAERPTILRANERAVVARFAIHLARIVEVQGRGLTVDVEYSRVGADFNPKRVRGAQIFPDLIVHRRSKPDGNLFAAEFKMGRLIPLAKRNRPCWYDAERIEELTRVGPTSDDASPYLVGACVTLFEDHADVWWFHQGERGAHQEITFDEAGDDGPA